MPAGWAETQLSLVCWIEDGVKQSGEKLVYWDAKALRGKTQKEYITSGKVAEQHRNVVLVDGENSGEVFLIPFKGYLGSTFKLLTFSQFVDIEYIKLILDYHRTLFRENKTGSAIPHLNKKLFRTLPIILPPLSEQARIVSSVRKNFAQIDIIDNNQTEIEQLYNDLKKKILDLAIHGKLVPQDPNDESASELLKRIRAEKKAQLGKKYIDSYIYKGDDNCYYEHIEGKNPDKKIELPFAIPDNWYLCKLKSFINVVSARRVHQSDWVSKGIPFYRAREIAKLANDRLVDNELFISEKLYNIYKQFGIPQANDLMVTAVGTIGQSYVVKKEDVFYYKDASVICFENRYNVNAIWLKYLMDSQYMKKQIRKFSAGTTVETITIEKANEYFIPIPPLPEQQRIVNKINEIFAIL